MPTSGLQLKRFVTALTLALSACVTVGPDYKQPVTSLPSAWRNAATTSNQPEELANWWHQFNDPALNALIDAALAASPDVLTAQSKLREARSRRGLQNAQNMPSVDASTSARRSTNRTDDINTSSNSYSAGFDASWEIDVFGGKRRALEASDANLAATEADLDTTRVSLIAEVASNYISLRTNEARLASTRANLGSRTETFQLTDWRGQAGLVSSLEVRQAQSSVEQTRASIPSLERSIEETKNNLTVLVGRRPGGVDTVLAQSKTIPTATDVIAIGIPTDTLRQRPDLRAAERRLAAQTAQIGVAEAARYPSFKLSGSLGLQALTPAGLLSADTIVSSLVGSIGAPIFDAGRIRQNIDIQSALQEQALINYEKTINQALADVETALNAYAKTGERLQSLRLAVDAAREAANLAQIQYQAGSVDLLTVLDSQRTLLSIEDQFASAQGDRATALVQLYKAMGGGWQTQADTGSTNPNIQSGADRK